MIVLHDITGDAVVPPARKSGWEDFVVAFQANAVSLATKYITFVWAFWIWGRGVGGGWRVAKD